MKDFNFATAFTIEFLYCGVQLDRGYLFDINGNGSLVYTGIDNSWEIYGSNAALLYGTSNGVGAVPNISTDSLVLDGLTWNHIALTMNFYVYRLFINGKVVLQFVNVNAFGDYVTDFTVGNKQDNSSSMAGKYSGFRIFDKSIYNSNFDYLDKPLQIKLEPQWFSQDAMVAFDGTTGPLLSSHGLHLNNASLFNATNTIPGSNYVIIAQPNAELQFPRADYALPLGSSSFTLSVKLYLSTGLNSSGDLRFCTLYSAHRDSDEFSVLLAWGQSFHNNILGSATNNGGLLFYRNNTPVAIIPVSRSLFSSGVYDLVLSYAYTTNIWTLSINNNTLGSVAYTIQYVEGNAKFINGVNLLHLDLYQIKATDLVGMTAVQIIGPASVLEDTSTEYHTVGSFYNAAIADVDSYTLWEIVEKVDFASIAKTTGILTVKEAPSQTIHIRATTVKDFGTSVTLKEISIIHASELVSISIAGPAQLDQNTSTNYTIIGTFANSTVADISAFATFSTSNEQNVAGNVDTHGKLTVGAASSNYATLSLDVSVTVRTVTLTTSLNLIVLQPLNFNDVELMLSGDILSTTVIPYLESIFINGVSALDEQTSSTFTVTGTFNNDVDLDLSSHTVWSIVAGGTYGSINSSTGILTCNNITGGNKTITVRATTSYRDITLTLDKVITINIVPVFSNIAVNGASTVLEQQTATYTVTGLMDDGSTFDATPYSTFSITSGNSYASVNASGIVTTVDITGADRTFVLHVSTTYNSLTFTQDRTITITWQPIFQSAVINGMPTMFEYELLPLTIQGQYDGGVTFDAGPYTTWEILSGNASINSSGQLLSTGGEGQVQVKATTTHLSTTIISNFTVSINSLFNVVELMLSGDILSTTVIPALTSIQINGIDIVDEQTNAQYTVTGHFNNGGIDKDLSYKTTWSVISGGAYGSINSSTGAFTASNITGTDQTVVIRATTVYRDVTLTLDKTITVNLIPVFSSVTVTGPSSITEQLTGQYSAVGNIDDGTTFDATAYTTWSIVSGASYASVDVNGLVTANNITASDKSITLRATVTYNTITVTKDTVINIVWVPILTGAAIYGNTSIIEYGNFAYGITGYLDGGVTFNASPYTTWAVIAGQATIDASGSLLSTGGTTQITIEATTTRYGNTVVSQFTVSVDPIFPYVEVLLSNDILSTTLVPVLTTGTINGSTTVTEQQTSQYTLTGHFTNGGADADLSSKTTWSIVSGGSYGSINSSTGLFTAANITPPNKFVTIRATTTYRYDTITTDQTITVAYVAVFDHVDVSGASSVNEQTTSQYTATGVMDDGTTFDASAYTTWSIVSGGAYGSINSAGLFTASDITASNRSVTLRATTTYNSIVVTRDFTLTVVLIPIFDHVTITGPTSSVTPATQQLSATGYLDDGTTTFNAMAYSTWSVISGSAYASVDASGLVTLSSISQAQSATIQVSTTYQTITKTSTLTISLIASSDPNFNNVALLLNGENVTSYSELTAYGVVLLNGELP